MCSVPEEVAVVEGPMIPDEEEQFDPTETLRAARLKDKQLWNIELNWSGNIEFKASHRESKMFYFVFCRCLTIICSLFFIFVT